MPAIPVTTCLEPFFLDSQGGFVYGIQDFYYDCKALRYIYSLIKNTAYL